MLCSINKCEEGLRIQRGYRSNDRGISPTDHERKKGDATAAQQESNNKQKLGIVYYVIRHRKAILCTSFGGCLMLVDLFNLQQLFCLLCWLFFIRNVSL
jgi:hypothetical protein